MSKSKRRLVFFLLIVSLTVTFLNSCVIKPTPKITGLFYEGKDYKDANYFEIKRSNEITVQTSNTNGSTYVWKIDDVTLVSEQGKNKFKFKDYENHSTLKNRLNEEFFKSTHQLGIDVINADKSISIVKQVKIINEAPEIVVTPDKIGPDIQEVTVKITDPENDIVVVSNTEIVDLNGKVLWTSGETDVTIKVQSLNLLPDVYVLKVYAKDQYGAEARVEKYIRLKQTYSIVAVRYEGKNIKYYDEPFIVNRYGKFQVFTDAESKVTYKISIGETSYISLDSITTTATQVSFELKKYNNNNDVPWDEYFAKDKVVNLKIDLYNESGILQDSFVKKIKIINDAPLIKTEIDEPTKTPRYATVTINDPDEDAIIQSTIKLIKKGSPDTVIEQKTNVFNWSKRIDTLDKGLYELRIEAKDKFGKTNNILENINTSPINQIERVKYNGQSMRYMQEPVNVNRTGEFDIDAKDTSNAKYTVKVDGIVLLNQSTTDTFKLKDYNTKLELSSDFFNVNHTLTIELYSVQNGSTILQDSFTKAIKIANLPPKIEFNPDGNNITVNVSEDEGDNFTVEGKLVDSTGKEIEKWFTNSKTIDKSKYAKGIYKIIVTATDAYGISDIKEYTFNTSPINEIERVKYNGQSMRYMQEPVNVNRTGEFDIDAKDTSNAKYTVKVDGIVLLNQSTTDTFKLKDYNTKLELSSDFFNVNHTLTIELYSVQNDSTILQDSFTKNIKITNLPPEIKFDYNNTTKILTVTISELEDDRITYKQGQIIDSSGKVISTWTDNVKSINVASLPKGNYTVIVFAKDEFGAETTRKEEITSLTYQNNPPSVSILQPYNNERTPISLTARWRGQDPDSGDVLRYQVVLKSGTTNVLSVETTSTEAVLPNLNYNTTYTLQVTVYDLQNASATTQVSFKTVSSPRYSYILSKSFDGKSVISIANTYNLPTVKIEGFVVNTDNTQFVDFDVAEDYIYAVGGTYLYVVNASDKSNPKIVKKVDLGTSLTAIRIYKNYAIIGEGSNGIRIVDLTNPSDPTLTSKNFGKTIKAFSLPVKTTSTKASKTTNSQINITQGKVMAIRLAADSAYIANNLGGLLRLNLTNIPNITINDITLIHDDQVNDTEIGQFNDKQVIVFAVGKTVKYALLSDAESATEELPSTSITTLGTFDTEIKGVRIYNNSIYAFTVDRIRKWTNDTTWINVEYEPGSQFNDLLFVGNNSVVLDGGKGLITYQNDSRNEPNKMYEIRDLNYLNNFLFAVGDGFYCNGLYVIDLRDTLEPTVRKYDTGQYLNKIDVKLKAVPKGSSERVAKIVVANTDSRVVKLYDFDYTNLTLSSATPVTLTGYTALYDVAIDAQGRTYVLGRNASGNVIQVFNQDGSAGVSVILPLSLDQLIPKFPANTYVEPVRPTSIQVVVDYLSESKKPSHVIVGCGGAGIIRYTINSDASGNITGINNELPIPTTYYVVVQEQDGSYSVKRYNPGTDSAVAVDKYFDRIFVADGDSNGVWILDKNGTNLTEQSADELTKTPFFAGAPARNISWFGDLLFVSGGGFGVKIINIRDMPVIDDTYVTKIPFNGLTYAFHTEADARTMVVGSDKGYLLYDISEFPTVKPISTLNLPMFKIMAK